MSITNMAGRLFTIHRRTPLVLDSQAAAAVIATPSRQPSVGSFVEVEVAVACSVTVGGLDKLGGTVTDTLVFTAAGKRTTVQRFSSLGGPVDAFTITVTAGNTVAAMAVGSDGGRTHQRTTLATGVKCHLNRGAARWPNGVHGATEVERTWIALDYTTAFTPREGDVFVDDGVSAEQWEVVGDPNWLGSIRPHHWEFRVIRSEGALDS